MMQKALNIYANVLTAAIILAGAVVLIMMVVR